MEQKNELITETASQRYHRELEAIKPFLPKDYKMQFLKLHPEYDSYKGGVLIHNVINGRSTDVIILEALKKLAIYPKTKKA